MFLLFWRRRGSARAGGYFRCGKLLMSIVRATRERETDLMGLGEWIVAYD